MLPPCLFMGRTSLTRCRGYHLQLRFPTPADHIPDIGNPAANCREGNRTGSEAKRDQSCGSGQEQTRELGETDLSSSVQKVHEKVTVSQRPSVLGTGCCLVGLLATMAPSVSLGVSATGSQCNQAGNGYCIEIKGLCRLEHSANVLALTTRGTVLVCMEAISRSSSERCCSRTTGLGTISG